MMHIFLDRTGLVAWQCRQSNLMQLNRFFPTPRYANKGEHEERMLYLLTLFLAVILSSPTFKSFSSTLLVSSSSTMNIQQQNQRQQPIYQQQFLHILQQRVKHRQHFSKKIVESSSHHYEYRLTGIT